jgi:hypothetical protein
VCLKLRPPVFALTAIDQFPATVLFQLKSNVALAPAAHRRVATVVGASNVITKTKLAHVSVVLVMSLLNWSLSVSVNVRSESTGPPPSVAPDKEDFEEAATPSSAARQVHSKRVRTIRITRACPPSVCHAHMSFTHPQGVQGSPCVKTTVAVATAVPPTNPPRDQVPADIVVGAVHL